MSLSAPRVLALDFDGVLCDGLLEYFQTAWRTYCHLWNSPQAVANPEASQEVAELFYQLRPVVETGWEMPVLIQAILLKIPTAKIFQDWPAIAQEILTESNLQAVEVAAALDQGRDQWIATDLSSWLALHRFYPGVIARLQQFLAASGQPVIVTTKEGRFVEQLLQQQGIELAPNQIFGKEVQRPKHQILRELLATSEYHLTNAAELWFIEDRLKTLQSVQKQPDLTEVQLYLADWGYNTATDRSLAAQTSRIQLLSLAQFSQEFAAWP
ncbi:HAD family hydrolase [Trichocoleus sp. FACHB-262]|uniref:HAD family hydrolase n=1 Tax=Trichocoleus sp. FACHB-262 TaxID=2692869 RepID=UPI0016863B22|nr:HAD family hydrolase [Trichocoleus sp. FACHB-262]MBD2122792.1 HAD family hydrolase [Trichocoleus sp. FACHB-262]